MWRCMTDSGTAAKTSREGAVQTKTGSFISTHKRKENMRMVTTSSVSVGGVRENQSVSQFGNKHAHLAAQVWHIS